MSRKWLWLTIGVVTAGFFVMAMVARYSEAKQSEAATIPKEAPMQPPLTFRERKARGLLTPEEQRIVDEVEKMKAVNREYEKERQIRVAREGAEKAAAYERQVEQDADLAKKRDRLSQQQVSIPPGYTTWEAEYQDMLSRGVPAESAARIIERAKQNDQRDDIRKWRYHHGLPTQEPTFWEKLLDPEW